MYIHLSAMFSICYFGLISSFDSFQEYLLLEGVIRIALYLLLKILGAFVVGLVKFCAFQYAKVWIELGGWAAMTFASREMLRLLLEAAISDTLLCGPLFLAVCPLFLHIILDFEFAEAALRYRIICKVKSILMTFSPIAFLTDSSSMATSAGFKPPATAFQFLTLLFLPLSP